MKRQTVVILDDIDGSEGAQTVAFSFRGVSYEIDLKEDHEKEMVEDLNKWISLARKVARPRSKNVAARGANVSAEARAWLVAQGRTVPARGRIPAALLEEFFAAHPHKRR